MRWRFMVLAGVTAVAGGVVAPVSISAAPGPDIGSRYAWGYNYTGSLGDNSWDARNVPVAGDWGAVPLADHFFTDVATSESTGDSFACGIAGGRAYCWGSNSYGQLGANSTDDSAAVPVAVSTSGALSGKTLTQITAGRAFACALDTECKAYCWGKSDVGQLGNAGAGVLSRVPVAVATSGVLAGKVLLEISSGNSHTCVRDGDVYCWGANADGQLGDGSFVDRAEPISTTMGAMGSARSIAAGWTSTCALSAASTAYCWGDNSHGQLGVGDVADRDEPTAVDVAGVLAGRVLEGVSINQRSACAWDSAAYCWGDNGNGQLGVGAQPPWDSLTPLAVDASGALVGKDIDLVSVRAWSACALDSDGVSYCWGAHWDGRLGIGPTAADALSPVAVSGGRTYETLSVGDGTVTAIIGPLIYTVQYSGNGADSGSAPSANSGRLGSSVTVAGTTGSLARAGYEFTGWNSRADGLGVAYAAGTGVYTITGNATLYAQWRAAPPPPPPAPTPPGAPVDVVATAYSQAVHVRWTKPVRPGSFPVTNYLVTMEPSGRTCLVAAPTTSCTVNGLRNGTTYTATVKALSGAGWGPASEASNAVTPMPPPVPSVAVTVTDVTDGVKVLGRTTAIKAGTVMWPYLHRYTKQGLMRYQGTARPVVGPDGTFSWRRHVDSDDVFEVIWCTEPMKKGVCSPWTRL